MSFSYSGNPASSSLDAVRFLIGDTNSATPQLQDAEINWELSEETNVYRAAAVLCIRLAAKFAQLATNKSVGDLSLSYAGRQKIYENLAAELRIKDSNQSVAPYMGGATYSDKLVDQQNPDVIQPMFNIEQFKEPLANTRSTDPTPNTFSI